MKKLTILIMFLSSISFADCVFNAKDKTKFTKINSNTILFSGGIGGDFTVKVYGYIGSYSEVAILKDYFCSYESGALLIDGSVVDISTVTKL